MWLLRRLSSAPTAPATTLSSSTALAATATLATASAAAWAAARITERVSGLVWRQSRLRPENLYQRLISALLVGVSAAHANRADHLIIDDDR
jgi:hypothetical protein